MSALYKMPLRCRDCDTRHFDTPASPNDKKHPPRCRSCDSTRLIYDPEPSPSEQTRRAG